MLGGAKVLKDFFEDDLLFFSCPSNLDPQPDNFPQTVENHFKAGEQKSEQSQALI